MKHNDILEDIVRRLKSDHKDFMVMSELEYDLLEGPHGEVDVLLLEDQIAYVIEVKHKDTKINRLKAEKQLWKDYQYVMETYDCIQDIKMFYAYSDPEMRRGYNVEEFQ